ncbi:hypothetical protein [Spirosoma rhododendri]|uniref:HicB family protein n=1 Tax=Spirosoma rhododendri TaxID=2728024 RepID=A0A7L5DQ57_9BACT|nr:hypothetical protein [Spirosoma rhododendri]QJD79611.1 hypothetical protein HH216_15185 [Spirosoma rhododendri]
MANSEKVVYVRIVNDGEGQFVGVAVDYPGVITFAATEKEVMDDIKDIWYGMERLNVAISKGFNPTNTGNRRSNNASFQVLA